MKLALHVTKIKLISLVLIAVIFLTSTLLPRVQADIPSYQGWCEFFPGGRTNAPPAVIMTQFTENGLLFKGDCVVRGMDDRLYHAHSDDPPGSWGPAWTNLGGTAISKPVLANSSDKIYLFVIGKENRIYYRVYGSIGVGVAWGPWTELGERAQTISVLGTRVGSDYYLEVVVRGMDNGVYYKRGTVGIEHHVSWTEWEALEGSTNDWPALTVNPSAAYLQLVVRGLDNKIWYKSMVMATGVWDTWSSIGDGRTSSAPALTTYYGVGNEWRTVCLVRGMDNRIYWTSWRAATGWSTSWDYLEGATDRPPTLCTDQQNYMWVFVRGLDGHLYVRRSHQGSSTKWYDWEDTSTILMHPPFTSPNIPVICPDSGSWGGGVFLMIRGAEYTYGGTTYTVPANRIWQHWIPYP